MKIKQKIRSILSRFLLAAVLISAPTVHAKEYKITIKWPEKLVTKIKSTKTVKVVKQALADKSTQLILENLRNKGTNLIIGSITIGAILTALAYQLHSGITLAHELLEISQKTHDECSSCCNLEPAEILCSSEPCDCSISHTEEGTLLQKPIQDDKRTPKQQTVTQDKKPKKPSQKRSYLKFLGRSSVTLMVIISAYHILKRNPLIGIKN